MRGRATLLPVLALVWAGVTIGGSLIAAPAKFGAPSIDMATALAVGREQFFWIWIAEGALCAALIGALVFRAVAARWWMWPPVAVFALQQLVLVPLLDARTVRTIAGESVPESNLHLVFTVLEFLKVGALVAAGIAALRSAPPEALRRPAS
ncbi:MAG: hypothetical protein OXF27_13565 [Acidobacteria bacterium]|nr:hypothetical protein [Acidobacteriota bacterium]